MRARDNPFRTSRVEALRYRADGISLPQLVDRLRSLGGRGMIHGQHGHGKTTLLHELAGELERHGLVVRLLRPDPDDRTLARRQLTEFCCHVGGGLALLLDGADRLGLLAWRRLLHASREAGVLVTTGRRPSRLPSLYHCRTYPHLLAELVTELYPESQLDDHQAKRLFDRHGGNIRSALRELYREQSMLQ